MDNKEIHNRYYNSSWHDDDGRSLSSISKDAKVYIYY